MPKKDEGGYGGDWTTLKVGNGVGVNVPSMTAPISPSAAPSGWVAPKVVDPKPAAKPAAKPDTKPAATPTATPGSR